MPEPSASHYALVPVKTSAALREGVGAWPSDELFLVTHRAVRQVPRVRVVWHAETNSADSFCEGEQPYGFMLERGSVRAGSPAGRVLV